MNCEVCQLKDLEVEHFEIREVLRCILHTIVFHRALGLVRPKDVDLELFDVTYVSHSEFCPLSLIGSSLCSCVFENGLQGLVVVLDAFGFALFVFGAYLLISSDSAFGMDMIKRMLQTGHPTMLS
ncbi:uncharacterized protein LOC112033099 [Quercus suber]|uniref:uncharacterized protein LOC112033099 n=1 Tax=Quercus suber TaxID=58331 RepID=UPI0032DE414B